MRGSLLRCRRFGPGGLCRSFFARSRRSRCGGRAPRALLRCGLCRGSRGNLFRRLLFARVCHRVFDLGVQVFHAERCRGLTQPLQPVERALLRREHVDDEVHVVHQHPLALAAALHRIRIHTKLTLQLQLDLIGDRDVLPVVGSVADEKVIRKAALRRIERQDANVFGLLVLTRRDRGRQHLVYFVRCHEAPSTALILAQRLDKQCICESPASNKDRAHRCIQARFAGRTRCNPPLQPVDAAPPSRSPVRPHPSADALASVAVPRVGAQPNFQA